MRHRNRLTVVLCSLLVAVLALWVFSLATFSSPTPAVAQEGGDAGAGPEAVDPDLEQLPPEPEKQEAETGAETEESEGKNLLEWMFDSLGWGYSAVFLAISFTLVSLLVMNILYARREAVVPMGLIDGFESLLNEKNYQGAYELAKNDESMLGQVLSSGLARISHGYSHAIEGMQETGEEENMKMEHRLSYIALIAQVSPMIGLLGTVHGMIDAFRTIATRVTAPKPAELAGDISTALFTTLVGLMIAIPAIAAYTILRNRIARLVLEVGVISENLMSRFSNVGPKKD